MATALYIIPVSAQTPVRKDIPLNTGWRSMASDSITALQGFEQLHFNDTEWQSVTVPHNWDQYEGYRRLTHGNRHGYAWYRNTFEVPAGHDKRYFLWFEGVGSYATVWVNQQQVGYHAGGRTSFTIDITEAVRTDTVNVLAVRTDHPAGITDLPWVCGGCSAEVGFSEGSQPMGIFRPVHLVITNPVRITPFGVHAWNDTTISEAQAVIHLTTEVRNYALKKKTITVINRLIDHTGKAVAAVENKIKLGAQQVATCLTHTPVILNPHLWSPQDPYLYSLVTEVVEKGAVIDQTTIPYGIRWINWNIGPGKTHQFYINGHPYFINGTAAYEHLMGQSHAFSDEQIKARTLQIKAAGFNAFRDAHQPHNLRYQHYWDSLGIVCWTQHTAHIWFDTPAFRQNFKQLLREWVIERRNSPSVILWGLQNESHLPAEFALECTELIRTLDPTTSSQRKVTTCNGGAGTDWDVPQNWTGTYGGNPLTYADDLRRQILVGEYGGWRSIDLHTEGSFHPGAPHSEEQLTQLMEMKVRLAEQARQECSGHFHWLFTSHENPGRVQGGEGYRELDRIGPVNYKGLLTAWGEPTDLFYMFRANYAPAETAPMVYIVSHTWPDRYTQPGLKDSVVVYSNCDSVSLYNDIQNIPLGTQVNHGRGTHFQWNNIPIRYNTLYAEGYVNGEVVAHDVVLLHHLPAAPHLSELQKPSAEKVMANTALHYLYRVNCGGPNYKDLQGNTWHADVHRMQVAEAGSTSWTDMFTGMPAFYASQRSTHDPIAGTAAWPLMQTFRYGREQLQYHFPVPDGTYTVELYFIEPWYGTGGGMDCTGWRMFDVAINQQQVLQKLDIWKEAGHDTVLKKVIQAHVTGGMLTVSFPQVLAGQAVVAAMAIATEKPAIQPAPFSPGVIGDVRVIGFEDTTWPVKAWADTGHQQYTDLPVYFSALPPALYGALWIQTPGRVSALKRSDTLATFKVRQPADIYIAVDSAVQPLPGWLQDYEDTHTLLYNNSVERVVYTLYRKRVVAGTTVILGALPAMSPTMYTVFARPVNTMQPAVDLRPTTSYSIELAEGMDTNGLLTDTILNKPCATFTGAAAALQWNIAVGVANQYALRFRYFHQQHNPLLVHCTITAADGTLMKEEDLYFPPVTEQKWKTVTTDTGSMINAGTYTITLTPVHAAGLSIREIQVQ